MIPQVSTVCNCDEGYNAADVFYCDQEYSGDDNGHADGSS